MEKQQWTTPVWSKNTCFRSEGRRKDVRYTYPDWGNAGPGVLPPTHHVSSQHIEGLWLEPSISLSSSCFTTLKDIQKKFPLQTTLQHSYPVLQPQRLYSQHSFQYTLAGNCLDAVEIGGQTVVVHVEYGSNDQAVVASRLVPGRYYQSDEVKEGDTYFYLDRKNNVLLDKYVYQVVSKALHNDVQVLVRTPTTVQLYGLRQTGFGKKNLEMKSGSFTSDAALSNTLPGLWSLVTVNGRVTLHDTDAKQPVWTTHCRETKGIMNVPARIFKCGFGRHPLFLFVGNESSVYLYDTRVNPNSHRTLFDIKKVQDHISINEHICSFVSGGDQPHLYLVMDESVYVVDDRQQKTPLMHWRHMLPERPTFSTLKKLDSLEILILSNSQSKEVCMISSEWDCGRQQCHGVSVPCHFPTLRDTTAFAHFHGLWFTSQVQERLKDSVWLGVTSVPHPVQNGSLLFLSMHSSGDIFLNTFQTSYTEADSAVFSEAEQGLTILQKWETDVVDISTHNWSYHNVNHFDVRGFCHQVLSRPSSRHIEEMLAGLPDIKLSNSSIHNVEVKGLVKNERDKQVFSNSENGAKKCSRNISNGKKKIHCNVKRSASETSFIWNLKDQVLKCKRHWTTKSTGSAAWNKSLMETYVIDPILDPSFDLPLHFNDSCTEDSLGKFLPGNVLDLKMDKIKKCKDFLSPRIMSLWLDGKNLNIKYKDHGVDGCETYNNGRLSSLLGMEVPEREHGFQYHTAPLDLARLSAKLNTYQPSQNRADQSPELDNLYQNYTYSPQTTLEINVKLPAKSKRTTKKLKKKKRVDGF